MGATIALGAWGGSALDARFGTAKPYWTVALSLLGIFAAIYLVFRDLQHIARLERQAREAEEQAGPPN